MTDKKTIDLNNYGITDKDGDDVTFYQIANFYNGFLEVADHWLDAELTDGQAWRYMMQIYAELFVYQEDELANTDETTA